eukprot:TRINITY_DN5646_c0_g2_i4.p1 TRINITY_DN5646_c0_g2~~TRINITY_DN5646_c0_g2_i4.p1  ORF type:complete len:401 (+),score=69.33 TRINITY_DN5646_c0_g2_i4:661-1863(+)
MKQRSPFCLPCITTDGGNPFGKELLAVFYHPFRTTTKKAGGKKSKNMEAAAAACGLSYDEVMGIVKNNQTPFEKEANGIWKHLDELAEKDPKEYRKFVDKQLKEGQEYMKQGGAAKKPEPIVPKSKFWVETEVWENGKGTGIPRIFNLCESEAIEYTDDKNLNIYMSDLVDKQIDCVIHTKFMAKCLDDNLFMHDTIQMVFATYKSDHKQNEAVRRQYKHHAEARKLVMKVPNAPPGYPSNKADDDTSALSVLGRVKHSEAARKMVSDEREEANKRLFDLYRGPESQSKAAKKDEPLRGAAAADPDHTIKDVVKKPVIVELKPKLSHTLETNADSAAVVKIVIPADLHVADISLELQEDDGTLYVESPTYETLRVVLPKQATNHTAKYLRKKGLLIVTVT